MEWLDILVIMIGLAGGIIFLSIIIKDKTSPFVNRIKRKDDIMEKETNSTLQSSTESKINKILYSSLINGIIVFVLSLIFFIIFFINAFTRRGSWKYENDIPLTFLIIGFIILLIYTGMMLVKCIRECYLINTPEQDRLTQLKKELEIIELEEKLKAYKK